MPLSLHETIKTVAHRGEVLDPLNKLLWSFMFDGAQVDHETTKQGEGQVDDGRKCDGSSF